MRFATICLLACMQAPFALAQDVDRATALSWLGLPANYSGQVETTTVRFKTLGVTVFNAKAIDRDGNLYSAAWDADGRRVTLSDLRKQEIAARLQTPTAKYHWKLEKALQTAQATRPLPVILWLTYPAAEWESQYMQIMSKATDDMTIEEYDVVEGQADAWLTAETAQFTASRVAAVEELGVSVSYASNGAPVLITEATPAQVLALAGLDIVDTVYLDSDDKDDYNDDAHATHRTDRAHQRGLTGRNADIGILENNRIDENHPWLTNCVDWFDLGGSAPDDHVQATSGCAASQHPDRIGAAPAADLYSANAASYSDGNVTLASDWISSTSTIDIMNGSFGPTVPSGNLDYSDRLFDYKSRAFADSYVMSAGNAGIGSEVGNIGWNIISVGSHSGSDDRGDWDNDVMSSFSSTNDPSTGCEKPNLAAVGENIETLGDGNIAISPSGCPHTQPAQWLINNFCGTSFSSPFVAGNLANALGIDATMSTPEPAMALLMATAWHNIEGATRLSEEDGAGGLHGWALTHAAEQDHASSVFLTPASFSNNGFYTFNISLQRGDRTRVCIAWSSLADSGYTTDVLDADLDLAVYLGSNQTSGTSFGFSSSFNNNFEIIEFTPSVTGTYTVRINDFRFDGASERVGIAWSQKYDDTTTSRLMDRNVSGVDPLRTGPTLGERFWLDINAPHSPGTMWLTTPGVVAGDGSPLGSQTWSPLVQNFWTDLWLENLTTPVWPWRGYTGTTNPNGYGFVNRLDPLFNFTFLIGLDIQHIGYLLDPAYVDGIREITEPHTMEFFGEATDRPLSDDGTTEVTLPFSFPFYGNNYNSVFINSNGNLTFGSGDTDFSESQAQMLSEEPRIALFWDDLNPVADGDITSREILFFGPRSLTVDYWRVTEFNQTNINTGRVTIYDDGRILLRWRECDLEDCIVGLSPGGGLSTLDPIDLSDFGFTFRSGAIYEVFSASNPFDLRHPGILGFGGEWWNELEFVPSGSGYILNMNVER